MTSHHQVVARRRTLPLAVIASTLFALVLALVAVASGRPALAQAESRSQSQSEGTSAAEAIQVLAVSTETTQQTPSDPNSAVQVAVDVAIPPAIGQLTPVTDNFGVSVNGSLVNNFKVEPLSDAVEVILAIDTSGSMNGRPMADAKAAASAFVDQLPERARVGVIGFGETVDVLQPPGTSRPEVTSGIASLEASGETTLWDALVAAAELADPQSQSYVVLLSDGGDTTSTANQSDAAVAMRSAGVALYAITIDSPEAAAPALASTVDAVGGNVATADNSNELAGLYRDVASRLANRYRLTFSPGGAEAGRIAITVAAPTDDATTADGPGLAYAQTFFDVRTAVESAATGEANLDGQGPARVLNLPERAVLGAVDVQAPGFLGSSLMLPVGAGAAFLALLLLGAMMLNPAVDVRLEAASGADRVTGVGQRLSAMAERVVKRRDQTGRLDRALDAAGINLRPGEFALVAATAVVVVALVVSMLSGFLAGLLVAVIGVGTVAVYLNARAGRRRVKFADQLTDTLTIMTGSLRAGRGLPQAMELVAAEASAPTSDEFRRIVYETRVGRDMTESMAQVAERMQCQDFEWVTRAVDINRELGGDLIEVLENVAETIRSRQRVTRMVNSLSAEGRASGWVMISLPVLMFLFMLWRTPDSAGLMFSHPVGRIMLLVAGGGMVAGYFWIRKLVDLRY